MKIVDSNEPWEVRQKLLELGWETKPLNAGDFCFNRHDGKPVGIERKTVADLLGSITTRLDKQLETMLDCYEESILLIEGSWRTAAEKIITEQGITTWAMSTVWNYLRSWQRKGITLELTTSTNHTIRRLNELYAYYQKPFHFGGTSKNTFTDDRILAFPTGCRGTTAMAVLKGRSLASVGCMSAEALQKIKNIGEKKAIAIHNHFNKGE